MARVWVARARPLDELIRRAASPIATNAHADAALKLCVDLSACIVRVLHRFVPDDDSGVDFTFCPAAHVAEATGARSVRDDDCDERLGLYRPHATTWR